MVIFREQKCALLSLYKYDESKGESGMGLLLYHGTNLKAAQNIEKRGVLFERCNEFTDFGKGFYTSKYIEFAQDTALNKYLKSRARGNIIQPAIVFFELKESIYENLNVYRFEYEDLEWLQFIVNNRNGWTYVNDLHDDFHNLSSTYHLIEGRIADGNISEYAEVCRKQRSRVSAMSLQSILYKGNPYAHQTSFHTKESLGYLRYIGYKEVQI